MIAEQIALELQSEKTPQNDMPIIKLTDSDVKRRAEEFASALPHTDLPFSKRNWGGTGHSVCSYQGKLKPSIGYFLVERFTQPGWTILDPLAGVGTIPFEARRQGRIGIASDLNPLAVSVCSSKLSPINEKDLAGTLMQLQNFIKEFSTSEMEGIDTEFGLNGRIREYFHEKTLHELVASREFFKSRRVAGLSHAEDFTLTAILHILHGNRPYALSRNSHPITPFKPSGDYQYKSVITGIKNRYLKVVPYFLDLQESTSPGMSFQSSYENVNLASEVDAVITSPPFIDSLRFWSSNWLRMWMAGWEPEDFITKPKEFLETRQKSSMEHYKLFSTVMARQLKTDGLLLLHLGVTKKRNMATEIADLISEDFRIISIQREDVRLTETHGLTDKGRTVEHAYLFARKN